MRARMLARLALLAPACAPNPSFQPSSGATEVAGDTDLSSGTGSTSSTTTSSGEPTTIDATAGESSSSAVTTGEPTTGEPSRWPASCGEVRDLGGATSGVYTIAHPVDVGQPLTVWCEQSVADGGWILLGRSVEDARDDAFGWTTSRGSLADDAAPYSLGPAALQLPFTQLLLAIHDGDKTPVEHIYALTVPVGFPAGFDDHSELNTTIDTLLGDCAPPGGPEMLRWLGYTAATDRFRLRDKQDDLSDLFGLRSDGYQLNYDDCLKGAQLNGRQGLIYLR